MWLHNHQVHSPFLLIRTCISLESTKYIQIQLWKCNILSTHKPKAVQFKILLHNVVGLTPLFLLILLLPYLVKIWGRYCLHGESKDQAGNPETRWGTNTCHGEQWPGAGIPKFSMGNNYTCERCWSCVQLHCQYHQASLDPAVCEAQGHVSSGCWLLLGAFTVAQITPNHDSNRDPNFAQI